MDLKARIGLLLRLGSYMQSDDPAWQHVRQKAFTDNMWFTNEFTDLAVKNIASRFLQPEPLQALAQRYLIPEKTQDPKRIGIVMAGNIPLVGFHDLICVFLSGHYAVFKPSSKDQVLITHLTAKMKEWEPGAVPYFVSGEYLKDCDAYIATGSDNTARHFEYYFRGRPSIIRKNRTSVALLTGGESREELEILADDVFQYFGLGCRNVTKLFVPKGYNFVPLLDAFRKYDRLMDFQKYKNNYDYNLAVQLLNNKYYMTNGSVLLIENESPFSPISQLHYEFYEDAAAVKESLRHHPAVQCVVGSGFTRFGTAQCPGIDDFADGVDTMDFLKNLPLNKAAAEVRKS
jgi:hypothetical protein